MCKRSGFCLRFRGLVRVKVYEGNRKRLVVGRRACACQAGSIALVPPGVPRAAVDGNVIQGS